MSEEENNPNISPRQFTQLPMYMTPQEVGKLNSGDHFGYSMDEAYPRVRAMAEHYASQHGYSGNHLDDLKERVDAAGGIERPIEIDHRGPTPTVINGHHRATIANETGRLIPVRHSAETQTELRYWTHGRRGQ
jgi:hypothetical protein